MSAASYELATSVCAQTIRLDLGGAVWEMRSATSGLRCELDERTREFLSAQPGEADVFIDVEWADSLSAANEVLFDAGLWKCSSHPDGLQVDFVTERLGPDPYKRAIFDRRFKYGRVLLNRTLLGNLESYYPLEYPLDELASLHRLGLGHGVELHCCGLATADGRGYLFVGHSGAGKSTLGKQWVKSRGATILSDDRVVVTGGDKGFIIHGTPWHGEAGLARNASAELRAVFLIRHGERNQTKLVAAPKAAAELLARSFVPWYQAEALDFTLSFLQRMSGEIPVYTFDCLPDESAVEYLERMHAI